MALAVDRCSCARIPLGSLPALAALRARDDVTVATDGDHAWVHWSPGDAVALRAVLAVRGAALYAKNGSVWRRHGERLGAPEVLEGDTPLRDLIPLPAVEAAPPSTAALAPAALRLVPSSDPRPTSAALVPLAALARWADVATTEQLAALRAARAGAHVLLLGARAPALPDGERFWGARVLVPLGRKVAPALGDEDLRALVGAETGELVLVRESGVELVPEAAFQVLSRASARLAAREAAP